MRPNELSVSGAGPTTRFIPAQPVKLFRGVSSVTEVTNLIPGAITVRSAALLVADPFTLVATHRNCVPLCESAAEEIVYRGETAPGILVKLDAPSALDCH